MLSLGEADVVPDDDEEEGDDVLGDMLLELLDVLPEGDVLDALDDELDVSVDGLVDGVVELLLELDDGEVVLGDIVDDELELDGGVVEGVVDVVDDVLLVSR